jgi:hypothetical protein
MRNLSGTSLVKILALALSIACTQSASAQHFKRVSVTGGAPLVQIAAGGMSVWARASNGKPYILNSNKFVLANSISLTQIAVGGGNTVKRDTVWGLDSSGLIYRATPSGTSWVFSQVPGVLDFIAVDIGYQDNCHPYEVWGLNPSAQIYRYNFCGKSFEQVAGTLGSLAVGGGDVWGINGNGQVYRYDFAALSFFQVPTLFVMTQIAVGPNGAWGIDILSRVWQLFNNGGQHPLPVGQGLTQIRAGGNGVWGIIESSQQIFRVDSLGTTLTSLVPVPGALVSISVGSGGGVWGLDSFGKAYVFTTP